jgi:flavin reductase (DIM6/NTAB) family NADH-FMN oxidoreductase RutF
MLHIEPKDAEIKVVHSYLLGGVGPRPIALVSTISTDGHVNLSPFSFFNAFGANPPTVAFSPSRRVRDNTTKHTYENLVATGECVIQAVTYDMVQQVNLASAEYPAEVDEFVKTGLMPEPSDIVRPPRVKQSPFQMECKLQQMISLGGKGGSGNLAICEVVKFHIDERLFDGDGVIHPDRIDLVARMSANYYCRASGDNVFVVKKPLRKLGIGYDQLPDFIKQSKVFSANNLGQLANTERVPAVEEVSALIAELEPLEREESALCEMEAQGNYRDMMRVVLHLSAHDRSRTGRLCQQVAKRALDFDDTDFAWKVTLFGQMAASAE